MMHLFPTPTAPSITLPNLSTPTVLAFLLAIAGWSSPRASAQCTDQLTAGTAGATGVNPNGAALADFNRDGRLDLAVSCQGSAAVNFYTGTAGGAFSSVGLMGTGVQPLAIITGDFNADGWPDFACAGDAGFAAVYMNNNGAFAPAQLYASGGSNCAGIATADFNGDGRADLAISNGGNATVSVLMGNGLGQFTLSGNYPTGTTPMGVVSADFNADGRPDLAVANQGSVSISILLCNAGGTFTAVAAVPTTIIGPKPIVVADFNLDGRPDLAVGSSTNTNPNLAVVLGTGPGTFGPAATRWIGQGLGDSLCIADFNADGRPDLLMGCGTSLYGLTWGGNNLSVVTGTNSGGYLRGIAAGDLNGDGLPDAVHTATASNQYRVILNTSTLAPLITQEPQRPTTNPGVPVVILLEARGTSLSFRWRRDGVNISNGAEFSGVTTASLTILNPTHADSGAVFDCVLTSSCATLTSRPVGLTVVDACGSQDFNGDGDFGTDADIEAFFRVLGGGSC